MAASASSAAAPAVAPNQTLYLRNLPDKMGKEALKRALYALFSSYGRILDIVALKTMKMRGQAHIVFEDVAKATAAMRGLQNFPFFDRPLKIGYAKTQSNAVTLHMGRYVTAAELAAQRAAGRAKKGAAPSVPAKRAQEDEDDEPRKRKREAEDEESGSDMETEEAEAAPAPKAAPEPEKPNRILFVYGLPGEITDEMLTLLFSQYPGFREVRLVPGKTDIAFVEFDSEANSKTAKEVLDGFKVTPKDRMGVSYAKVGT